MMWKLFVFFTLFACILSQKVPDVEYDIIVISSGPAGLSATSALCRVGRKVIIFNSGEYRNEKTRNMHNIIRNNGTSSSTGAFSLSQYLYNQCLGTEPLKFRAAACIQILKYKTVTIKDVNIVEVTPIKSPNSYNWFVVCDSTGLAYTARRIILGTGITDVIPSTPSAFNIFSKGMFCCP
jgi:thioredoxin reductase